MCLLWHAARAVRAYILLEQPLYRGVYLFKGQRWQEMMQGSKVGSSDYPFRVGPGKLVTFSAHGTLPCGGLQDPYEDGGIRLQLGEADVLME